MDAGLTFPALDSIIIARIKEKSSTHIQVRYLPGGECKRMDRCISQECLGDTGFSYTLSLINGKYKMTILYTLMEFKVVRFNEIKRYIKDISYKTLSSTLKELEADRLVHREEYPQIPPKVEYSLTERGKSLIPILDGMCEWGDQNRL
jgi:DNA-binding HxlR family transcriptional regulator